MVESILSKVRSEGYQSGWSQASMIAYDDAFELGRQEAEVEYPSRLKWFTLGVISSTVLVSVIGYLF